MVTIPEFFAAPMAGGPATPQLVAAVAGAHPLASGFLAGGYQTAAGLADQIEQLRQLCSRPFGVNLFVPPAAPDTDALHQELDNAAGLLRAELTEFLLLRQGWADAGLEELVQVPSKAELARLQEKESAEFARQVELLAHQKVPFVSFTFGLPPQEVVTKLQEAGCMCFQTVTSAAEALAALEHAPFAGLVVQGAEAGGHAATFTVTPIPPTTPLLDLLDEVTRQVMVPVVAAGGISGPEDKAAAHEAGAQAVQVGTALLRTPEAGTNQLHRRALAAAAAGDFLSPYPTAFSRAYTGRWARGLSNALGMFSAHATYPWWHVVTKPLRADAAAHAHGELTHLWAGTGVRLAEELPAAAVVQNFFS